MNTIKEYYQLAKPGIIYGNALTAIAGFFLASKHHVDLWLFVEMLIGLSLVIGASCVFNNYIDRDIDIEMQRTKERASVTGKISPRKMLVYGNVLLIFGILLLYLFTNILTLVVALVGVVTYVAIYTPLKRRTSYSTLIGSIAGATPPVVGFCAVTNTFNREALLLFLILFFWQLPHFFAISLYRIDEYAKASVPTLPIEKGIKTTKIHILIYIIAFIVASLSLTFFGFTGYVYFVVELILGLVWLSLAIKDFQKEITTSQWARRLFFFSLIIITVWSILLSFNVLIP